jgi:hypothetical protein
LANRDPTKNRSYTTGRGSRYEQSCDTNAGNNYSFAASYAAIIWESAAARRVVIEAFSPIKIQS